MRLLICTQTVDSDDPVLGFFHRWIEEFSKNCERVTVVCLREGAHNLPSNVRVYSLGKEKGGNRLLYTARFLKLIVSLRRSYDSVFVHMNPEYVVLGGLFWRAARKRVYMWRNHWKGGLITDIAVALSHKIFCTSKASYIAKYQKNVLMPVGIDTDTFKPVPGVIRRPRSVLSLGRIAPSKNIHVILEALHLLKQRGVAFTASVYGDALPKDQGYLIAQKQFVADHNLSDRVSFYPGVKNSETPAIYSAHEIFVNASASGMFDKTIFEAIACGCTSIASSRDYLEFSGPQYWFEGIDALTLAEKIEKAFVSPQKNVRDNLLFTHELSELANRLNKELSV
jgi:glycosyltransferase involved in cell wall biosynthesis